uniref:Uncharacterized protein n=1 Tax=Lepeophtheirus salmonis TaxID=72036 RepID=A0A0K2TQD5_LEPSM
MYCTTNNIKEKRRKKESLRIRYSRLLLFIPLASLPASKLSNSLQLIPNTYVHNTDYLLFFLLLHHNKYGLLFKLPSFRQI